MPPPKPVVSFTKLPEIVLPVIRTFAPVVAGVGGGLVAQAPQQIEQVLAIGNPLGLSRSVTFGIVSAVGRADVGVADFDPGRAEVVEEADVLLFVDLRHLEAFAIPLDRELRHPLFEEAETEHRRALDGALRILRRQLELADGFVDQAHFFVGEQHQPER